MGHLLEVVLESLAGASVGVPVGVVEQATGMRFNVGQ